MMPVHQRGDGSSFIVYGDFYDNGAQIGAPMGGPVDAVSQTKYIYVPPLPLSPRFTGQEMYLGKMRDYFAPQIPGSSVERRCLLLHGMGGVGKTQLSLKFAEETAHRFWIFWVDSSSRETIERSIKAIAEDPVARSAGVKPSTRSVLQWLSRTDQEWLLVFDNADHSITEFMPTGTRGNILITSRNPMMAHHVSSPEARLEVDAMEEDDAVSLLLKSAQLENASSDVASLATAIVRELCCLPLAVDQAGAAIACGLCNIRDYLDRYFVRRQELMSLTSFKGASNYGQAVYTSWDLSYMAIQDGASGASELTPKEAECSIFLLEIFSFFYNENILEGIFRRAAEAPMQKNITIKQRIFWVLRKLKINLRKRHFHANQNFRHKTVPFDLLKLDASGHWDPQTFRAGIQILISFSLIKRHENGESYSMHPLVHSWSRDRMAPEHQRVRSRTASSLLAHSIIWDDLATDFAFRRDLIPHIKWCSLHLAESEDYTVEELSHFGFAYYENGFYEEAAELQEMEVKMYKKLFGKKHTYTLSSMQNLAVTYMSQGRQKEAEKLEMRVLKLRTKVLGEEHPRTLQSMNNLALTYSNQGRYKDAEKLQMRVLGLMNKVLGEEHPNTLKSMHNLVWTYNSQGRFKEAEEMGIRVLKSEQQALGEEHPNTLIGMANLAWTYESQGRSEEAEKLGVRVLELMNKVLGEEHPHTLSSMHSLAGTYNNQGRYKEAEELGVRVWELKKKVLGEEHRNTLSSMQTLALIYGGQERHKEAEDMGVRVLELSKKVLGERHPDTLGRMHNLAATYERLGHHKDAEELGVRVLGLRKKVLGEEHPSTLESMHNMALIYWNQGRHKEAEALEVRVLQLSKKALGEDHPSTLVSRRHLACYRRSSSENQNAI